MQWFSTDATKNGIIFAEGYAKEVMRAHSGTSPNTIRNPDGGLSVLYTTGGTFETVAEGDTRELKSALAGLLACTEMRGDAAKMLAVGKAKKALKNAGVSKGVSKNGANN